MNRVICCLIVLILSCAPEKQTADIPPDTLTAATEIAAIEKEPTTETTKKEVEDDCVFNNNYKALTSEWLADL